MEICNTLEFFKTIKKAHLLLSTEGIYALEDIIKELPYELNVSENSLSITLLPSNLKIDSQQKKAAAGIYWDHKISFDIASQSKSILDLLDFFTNKNIVLGLELLNNSFFIYGNSNQPLHYIFKEINSKNNEGFVGYQISISGKTITKPYFFSATSLEASSLLPSWLPVDL